MTVPDLSPTEQLEVLEGFFKTRVMAEEQIEALGIIAGNRTLPLVMARQARAMGVRRLVAVAFEGETDPKLAEFVDEIAWVRVGQLTKMIQALTNHGVKQCVMAG